MLFKLLLSAQAGMLLLLLVQQVALAGPPVPQSPAPWVVFGMSLRSDCRDGFNYSPAFNATGNCVTIMGPDLQYSFSIDCKRDRVFRLYVGSQCGGKGSELYNGPTPVCLDNFFLGINMGVCCTDQPPDVGGRRRLGNEHDGQDSFGSAWMQRVFKEVEAAKQQDLALMAAGGGTVEEEETGSGSALQLLSKRKSNKEALSPFPFKFCFSGGGCGPAVGTNKAACARKTSCNMKWVASNCRSPLSTTIGAKGCLCQGFCDYGCAKLCKRDKQCQWNQTSNTCSTKPEFARARDKYCVPLDSA